MPATQSQNPRTLDIDFLYIDLTTCTRCRGTDENLARALDLVRSSLSEAGVTVNLRKVLVDSEDKADAKARGGDGPCCPTTSSGSCCGAEALPSAPVAKAAGCGCAA